MKFGKIWWMKLWNDKKVWKIGQRQREDKLKQWLKSTKLYFTTFFVNIIIHSLALLFLSENLNSGHVASDFSFLVSFQLRDDFYFNCKHDFWLAGRVFFSLPLVISSNSNKAKVLERERDSSIINAAAVCKCLWINSLANNKNIIFLQIHAKQ